MSLQRFKFCLRIAWAGKQIQYSPPSGVEAIFSKMIRANKKDFIFQQGNCTMNVLHLSLSKSFPLNICSRDTKKNSTLEYFCKITYSQMHCKLQPWCLFGRWLFRSLISNFSSPLYVTCFVRQSLCLPNTYGETDFVSSILWNKLEKYTFLWFKKETYFWWKKNISEFFPKIC